MFTKVKFWGRRLAGPVFTISLLSLSLLPLPLFIVSYAYSNHASALTHQEGVGLEFTFNPTLSLSLSSNNISIDNLSPGSYAYSNTISVNVSTNNSTGYTLSAKVGDGNTYTSDKLVNANNSSNYTYFNNLSSLSSTVLSSFNDDEWGYTLASNNDLISDTAHTTVEYTGLVYNTNTPINVTTDINGTAPTNTNYTGTNTTNFTIGAKASITKASGTYSNVITFTAVTNPITTVSLYDSYKYYNKTKYNGYFTMQDMTGDICSRADIDSKLQVIDIRDKQVYTIAKLKDEKCWMLENLSLDISDTGIQQHLSSSTTNATDTILNSLKNRISSTWDNSYTLPRIDASNKNTEVASYGTQSNKSKVGIYYNYCAASAHNYCHLPGSGVDREDTNQDTQFDICPKNWRLPTGGSSGDFQTLQNAYDSYLSLRKSFNLTFSGYYNASQTSFQNENGYLWTSTIYDGKEMMASLGTSAYISQYHYLRVLGMPIRCISH